MRLLTKILLVLWPLIFTVSPLAAAAKGTIPIRSFKVIRTLPHDPNAFTQGLLFNGDHLYESTGQYGSSQLRRVEWSTGKVVQAYSLDGNLFGEGIALVDRRIYQLTWMSRYCLVFDRDTLKPGKVMRIDFSSQGWGLTWDGHSLIASDGSDKLYFLDPSDLSLRRSLKVTLNGRPLNYLNELEMFQGRILANIWQDTRIAEISPLSGRVTAWIDCSRLVPSQLRNDRELVLNGIAQGPQEGQLFVTGKQWPVLYLIEPTPRP